MQNKNTHARGQKLIDRKAILFGGFESRLLEAANKHSTWVKKPGSTQLFVEVCHKFQINGHDHSLDLLVNTNTMECTFSVLLSANSRVICSGELVNGELVHEQECLESRIMISALKLLKSTMSAVVDIENEINETAKQSLALFNELEELNDGSEGFNVLLSVMDGSRITQALGDAPCSTETFKVRVH